MIWTGIGGFFQHDYKKTTWKIFKIQVTAVKFWNFGFPGVYDGVESISTMKIIIKTQLNYDFSK